jgi:hypothetical protein
MTPSLLRVRELEREWEAALKTRPAGHWATCYMEEELRRGVTDLRSRSVAGSHEDCGYSTVPTTNMSLPSWCYRDFAAPITANFRRHYLVVNGPTS